jgi:hypothetical protein
LGFIVLHCDLASLELERTGRGFAAVAAALRLDAATGRRDAALRRNAATGRCCCNAAIRSTNAPFCCLYCGAWLIVAARVDLKKEERKKETRKEMMKEMNEIFVY